MHELLGRFQKKVSAHSQNMRRGCENECARASHMCVDLIVIKKKRRMLQASNKNNNSVQMKYAMAVVTGAVFFSSSVFLIIIMHSIKVHHDFINNKFSSIN